MRSVVIEAAISIDQVSLLPAIHNSDQCGNRIDSHYHRLSPCHYLGEHCLRLRLRFCQPATGTGTGTGASPPCTGSTTGTQILHTVTPASGRSRTITRTCPIWR